MYNNFINIIIKNKLKFIIINKHLIELNSILNKKYLYN